MATAKSGYLTPQRKRFFIALVAAGVGATVFNQIAPPSGTLIAAGVFFVYLINTGEAQRLIDSLNGSIGNTKKVSVHV